MSEDLISREKAYEALTEYYHHKTEMQHKALREALDMVPSAELQPTCNQLATNLQPIATDYNRLQPITTDYIRREDAIDAIENHIRTAQEPYVLQRADEIMNYAFEVSASCIYNLPPADIDLSDYSDRLWRNAYEQGKADAEPRWIPVTERLPEDGERVLLQIAEVCLYGDSYVEDYYYVSGSRSKGRWFINVHPDMSVERDGIIAWMPLPEPWKGGTDDAN